MWRRRCCGSSPPPTPIARARSSTSTARAWRVSAELFGGATGPESIVHPLAIVGERFQSHLGARRVDMLRIVILHRPQRQDGMAGLASAELRCITLFDRKSTRLNS